MRVSDSVVELLRSASSTGAHQELNRWRGDSGAGPKTGTGTGTGITSSDRRPLAFRDAAAGSAGGGGGGLLSPPSFNGGGGPSSIGYSDRFSGDGSSSTYADGNGSLSGAPPRTAFLSRDEVSEDSRLLQQILRESEEEIAASAADRANGFNGGGSGGSGSGGGSKTKLVSAAGIGSGDDLYGGTDDNLHSLDVDRIIESMELEAGVDVDGDVAARGRRSGSGSGMPPWRASAAGAGVTATATATSSSRRRSFTTDGVGGGGGGDGGGDGGGVMSSGRRERGASASGASASSPRNDGYGLGVPGSRPDIAAVRKQNGKPLSASRARRNPSQGGGRSPVSGGLLSGATAGGGGGELGLTGALRKAEAAELRLLRGGNREMISPLQVCLVYVGVGVCLFMDGFC